MKRNKRSGKSSARRRRMPGLVGVLAASLILPLLAGTPPVAEKGESADKPVRRGQAKLRPIDDSGIRARIEFVEDGTTLRVTGTAKGLDPTQRYITLIYDNGSVPRGPMACQPSIFDPTDPGFLLATMFIAFWTVDSDGQGKLKAFNTNGGLDFVSLDRFSNTSVRLVTGPPPKGSVIPMTELVACGQVLKSVKE